VTHQQQGMNIEMHVNHVDLPKEEHGLMAQMMDIRKDSQRVDHVGL